MNNVDAIFKRWERASIVRTRPRRILNDKDCQTARFFPPERLPLCMHPEVIKMGDEVLRFIQVQALYHYLNGIANIELDIINDSSHKLYKNKVGLDFPLDMRLEALTVVVDESYHALVALDLSNQVAQMTGISAIHMPEDTEASYALAMALNVTPAELKELVRLVCVSLSEQALTTDLIDVIDNENIFPSFYLVMKDHVADEGRHARFSQLVLEYIWCHSNSVMKEAMKIPIVTFLEEYSTDNVSISLGMQILREIGMDESIIAVVIADTYPPVTTKPWETNNIVTQQMLLALKKADIISDLPLVDSILL